MYIFANWIEPWPLQWPTDLLFAFWATNFKFGPHVHFCILNWTLTFVDLYHDLLTYFLFFEPPTSNLDHMYIFAYWIERWPELWPTDQLFVFWATDFKFGPHVHFCILNWTLTFVCLYRDLLTYFLFFELPTSNLDHMYIFAYWIELWPLLTCIMTYWPTFCFWATVFKFGPHVHFCILNWTLMVWFDYNLVTMFLWWSLELWYLMCNISSGANYAPEVSNGPTWEIHPRVHIGYCIGNVFKNLIF